MTEIYHPTTLVTPPEQLRDGFVRYTHTSISDPTWQFEIGLPKSVRMAPPPTEVPAPGGNPLTLALFNTENPACDIEVYGQHLQVEVDPADVLELFLEKQPIEILSRKPVLSPGGIVGDVVVRWKYEEKRFLGRFFAIRNGPRLIMLWFRTPEDQYAQTADAMFVTLSSLRMVDGSAGIFAEPMQTLSGTLPVPWRTQVPTSWDLKMETSTAEAASFQANLLAEQASSITLAQLSVSVIANTQVASPEFACSNILEALRDAGVFLPPEGQFRPAPVDKPYLQLWHLTTEGSLQGQAVTVHARLLQHDKAWFAAAAVGPAREVSAVNWMRVKRLLDVVCMMLEFP